MANNIKWTAIEHNLSKKKGQGKHIILVAYKPNGKLFNTVLALAPLYDLYDANLDGKTTWLERGFGWNLYDPYYVFELMNSSASVSCALEVAIQMRDYEFKDKVISGFLKNAFKIAQQALVTIMVEKALSPGLELTLAKSGLANLGEFSDTAQFLVQTAIEEAVIASITK